MVSPVAWRDAVEGFVVLVAIDVGVGKNNVGDLGKATDRIANTGHRCILNWSIEQA